MTSAIWGGSIRTRSRRFAPKPGRWCATWRSLHDALLSLGALPASDGTEWTALFHELVSQGRAARCLVPAGPEVWFAAERWPLVQAAYCVADCTPPLRLPESLLREVVVEDARLPLVRGRLEICGPVTAWQVAADLGLDLTAVQIALEQLESQGVILRGQFTNAETAVEWCERRLLARIHRLTLEGLRERVQPVDANTYFRFLLSHHGIMGSEQAGRAGLRRRCGN